MSGQRPRRLILPVALALVALIVAAVAWVGLRVLPVRSDLSHAGEQLQALGRQIAAGDLPAARATLDDLRPQLHSIASTTDGWDWRLAAHSPVVGADLSAVRVVARVLDDLGTDALPVMVDLAGSLDVTALVPSQERMNAEPLAAAAPALRVARDAIERSVEAIETIDVDTLRPDVGGAVIAVRDVLTRLAGPVAAAATASTVLPSMLGANGTRTVLVLFQNPAELRATGGIAGAFIVVRAEHGQLSLADHGTSATDLGVFGEPVLPLTPAQTALYTDRLGRYPANVNLTPDFPTAARIAAEMYRIRSGTTVDSVIATDPVALSYLLAAIGPLTVASGPTLTGENTVRVLLSDIYASMDGPAQDRYIMDVAVAMFSRLSQGVPDARATLAALAHGAGEHRLLVFSAHPDEQAEIGRTQLAGSLPSDDAETPTIGVFLNDGSGAKLDYYLTGTAALTAGECRPDGRRAFDLQVELSSNAPQAGLSAAVLGLGLAGDPYTMRTNVMLVSPVGGALLDISLDAVPTPFAQDVERERTIGVLTVDLAPGQKRRLEVRVLSRVGPGNTTALSPVLWVTPGGNPWSIRAEPTRTCPVSD